MKDYTLIPNEYLDEIALSIKAKYLLCVLLKHCRDKNQCWPSQKRLSKAMNCSTRTVRKYLTELEECGYMTKTTGGFKQPNIYFVKNRLRGFDIEDETMTGSQDNEDVSRVKVALLTTGSPNSHSRKDVSSHSGKNIPNTKGKSLPTNIKNLIIPTNITSHDRNEGLEILRNKMKELNLKK